ncbi:MAG TPA: glycogen/starch synthase, partial [Verrucomicrobiota bacterium]|nr:glycogen/starch synthase [Verrucomicrobiota bacterium]
MTPPIRNVILVAPEAEPFYRKGGLGNVCGELAAALSRTGLTTHLVTGWYESMQANPPPCIEGGVSCSVAIGPHKYEMSVLRGVYNGVTH